MQVTTANYQTCQGWIGAMPAALDSQQTRVIAFGAKSLETAPAPFESLAAAFPHSVIVGCSTAGEIAGACVNDESISVAVARFARTRLKHTVTAISDAQDSLQAGARLGMALLGDGSLALINDNDFGIRGDATVVLVVKGAVTADPAAYRRP